jgi:aminoglycoside phosphotransferase (APT) family kinase protein
LTEVVPEPEWTPRQAASLARRIAEGYFGAPPRRVRSEASGRTNFVFQIDLDEGRFVIRLSPRARRLDSFRKEKWAVERVRELGVPGPRILEVGNEIVPFPYMIAHRASGKEASHHPDRMRILVDLGRMAVRIHSARTEGFGRIFDWSADDSRKRATWQDYLTNELELEQRLSALSRLACIGARRIDRIRCVVEALGDHVARPGLCHGDLRLKNVIVDREGEIVAIIDWEKAISTVTPAWELSHALHDLWIDAKEAFLEGYGLSPIELEEISPAMKAFNLLNYAPILEDLAEEGDRATLEQYRARLAGALDLYSV